MKKVVLFALAAVISLPVFAQTNKEAIKVSRRYLEKLISENKVQLEEFANFTNLVENKKEELNNE